VAERIAHESGAGSRRSKEDVEQTWSGKLKSWPFGSLSGGLAVLGRVQGTSGRLEGLISKSRSRGKIADGQKLCLSSLYLDRLVWLGSARRSAESRSLKAFGQGSARKFMVVSKFVCDIPDKGGRQSCSFVSCGMCQSERLRLVSLIVVRGSQDTSKHQNVGCCTFRFVRNGSANFWRALHWYLGVAGQTCVSLCNGHPVGNNLAKPELFVERLELAPSTPTRVLSYAHTKFGRLPFASRLLPLATIEWPLRRASMNLVTCVSLQGVLDVGVEPLLRKRWHSCPTHESLRRVRLDAMHNACLCTQPLRDAMPVSWSSRC
jgi:hypothetical protein